MKKTSEKPSVLKTNHTAQTRWLDGQIRKNNLGIFLNAKIAIEAYDSLKDENMGILSGVEIESYMGRYLSAVGMKKLVTTLRVAETRTKCGFALQVTISSRSKTKFDYLASKTGMKKNEIIEKLLELSDLEKLTKTKEQLEITM